MAFHDVCSFRTIYRTLNNSAVPFQPSACGLAFGRKLTLCGITRSIKLPASQRRAVFCGTPAHRLVPVHGLATACYIPRPCRRAQKELSCEGCERCENIRHDPCWLCKSEWSGCYQKYWKTGNRPQRENLSAGVQSLRTHIRVKRN